MQLSGTFPQLSDNAKKTIRKQITLRSAAGMQQGGVLGPAKQPHTRSTAGNRAKARSRARGGQ